MFVWSLYYKYLKKGYALSIIDRSIPRQAVLETLEWVCEKSGHRLCSTGASWPAYNKILNWVEANDDGVELEIADWVAQEILPDFVASIKEEAAWEEFEDEELTEPEE